MNLILVVNDSPWGSVLAVTALRVARAAAAAGHDVDAIFFRGEGVYNAMSDTIADAGTPQLAQSWAEFSDARGVELLVCQSSARRRLGAPLEAPFREAGLVEFVDRLTACDRVVTL